MHFEEMEGENNFDNARPSRNRKPVAIYDPELEDRKGKKDRPMRKRSQPVISYYSSESENDSIDKHKKHHNKKTMITNKKERNISNFFNVIDDDTYQNNLNEKSNKRKNSKSIKTGSKDISDEESIESSIDSNSDDVIEILSDEENEVKTSKKERKKNTSSSKSSKLTRNNSDNKNSKNKSKKGKVTSKKSKRSKSDDDEDDKRMVSRRSIRGTKTVKYDEPDSDEGFLLDDTEEMDLDKAIKQSRHMTKKGSDGVLAKARNRKSSDGEQDDGGNEADVKIDEQENGGSNSSQGEASGSDDDEEHSQGGVEYKVQHILRSQKLTASQWVEICDKMNTQEISRGSVWRMSDEEYYSKSPVLIEKFLIKWQHASYLHLSWETEIDLETMIGSSAKQHVNRYRNRCSQGEDLFDDLRHGEYFSPQFLVVERILDVDDATVNVLTIDWENAILPCDTSTATQSNDNGDVMAVDDNANNNTATMTIDDNVLDEKDEDKICDSDNDNSENIHDSSIDGAGEEQGEHSSEEERLIRRSHNKRKSKIVQDSDSDESGEKESSTANQVKAVKRPLLHGSECWVTVKWEGLPYGDATFENLRDLQSRGIEYERQMRLFYKREQLPPVKIGNPKRVKRALGPDLLNKEVIPVISASAGTLRDYQWEGVRWMLFNWSQKRNSILADEMVN